MVNKKADRRCGGFPRQAEDMTEKNVAQTQFGCEEGGAEGVFTRVLRFPLIYNFAKDKLKLLPS